MTETKLKPANKNPWYVLATVYGEQTGEFAGRDLHQRNRRIWNGWACGHMNDAGRATLAAQRGWPVSDFAPLTATEQADLKEAFNDRLGSGTQIPDSKDEIDLSEIHFSHTVTWERYIFSQSANFQNATFSMDANFQNATFSKYAIFQNATFSMDANFENTIFSRNFGEAAVFQNATFSKGAHFGSVTFPQFADFKNATFSDSASFHNSTFPENAHFQNATFTGTTTFISASFSRFAHFEGASFSTVYFQYATFSARAYFQNAAFSWSADFPNATFSEYAQFENATFTKYADFQNATFTGTTSFARAHFKTTVPRFHDATLPQDTEFTTKEQYWPTSYPDAKSAERAKDDYNRLRQFMNSLQKPDDEHFFHRRELECQAHLEKGLNRLMLRAYGLFSDYGYSITRPVLWLVGMIALFWPVYASYLRNGTHESNPIWQGLGVSISSTFSFLGFMRTMHPDFLKHAPIWIDFISGTQTILGVVFLFLFGLGLRTRFRMR